MSSSSVGRPALASCSFSSSPSAVRILVILEYPSSPSRPFSRASSVESPTLAFFASVGCVRPSALRLVAICSPSSDRGNIHLIYKFFTCNAINEPRRLGLCQARFRRKAGNLLLRSYLFFRHLVFTRADHIDG